ncbi:MAG: uroporphyrinogen-III C-methyltransferase [Synergistaceae bacterium]|nr:uroporphyrinogen-III C-methyltransferase [Synergistaceae bacterium]
MIYLIGAGPGDSGLLTLRGLEVLKKSEVVIYDRLVGEGVLALIPDSAERIDAGKSLGAHNLSQEKINELLINFARAGKTVARLKGGDPFLFGRGGEEAEAIIKAGLEFEIVPGVSSALAVPAWAGIPVTHRNFCAGVNIFTAHDKNNLLPDFQSASQIFLMGVAHAEELEKKLLSSLSPDTPCAIISQGTTSRQQVIRTRLENLSSSAKKISPPAIIITGKVSELNLNWRKTLPLDNKRILITRPKGRGETLAEKLRDNGAEVILMPTIKTKKISGALKNKNLSGYDFIGFTSVTGVEKFFELLSDEGRDVREIGLAKIAAIGQATASALRARGLRVDYVPEIFDGKNLAEGLVKKSPGKILMLRALNGSPEISEVFEKNKIPCDEICIYQIDFVKLAHIPKFIDTIIFTSASTVRGFAESVDYMRDVKAVCIGEQTAKEARGLGFKFITIAKRATVEAIFEAVLSCWQ